MALMNHYLTMKYILDKRIVYIGGRVGGGKTSLSFRMAYDLMQSGQFRYLLSNLKSVWTDDIEDVTMREYEGVLKLDAVIILDEAGEFIDTKAKAKKWKSYLRKMNVVMFLPSEEPPAASMRTLSIERIWDGYSIGLPLWYYKTFYNTSHVKEGMAFSWLFPSEIFGVYDTDGYPADEAERILEAFKGWVRQAAAFGGYAVADPSEGDKLHAEQSDFVAQIERAVDDFSETAEKVSASIPLLERKKKGRRK